MVEELPLSSTDSSRRYTRYIWEVIRLHWKFWFTILYPLLLIIPIFTVDTQPRRCLYVLLLMIGFWVTRVLPMAVTSFIPIVLFPFFRIMKPDEVCSVYFSTNIFRYMGTMIICTAIEECNLHHRIALQIVQMSQCRPIKAHVIVCILATLISAWYNNIATAVLMTSVTKSVLRKFEEINLIVVYENELSEAPSKKLDEALNDDEYFILNKIFGEKRIEKTKSKRHVQHKRIDDEEKRPTKISICFSLGIAYAIVIGGTTLPISSVCQKILNNALKAKFPKHTDINSITWFLTTFPIMATLLVVMIGWLQFLYMGFLRPNSKEALDLVVGHHSSDRLSINVKSDASALGRLKFAEWVVLILFIVNILISFFKDPGFLKGWHAWDLVQQIDDATVAICTIFPLFCIPKTSKRSGSDETSPQVETILSWKAIEERVPWNMLILIGAGFATKEGIISSGLYQETFNLLTKSLNSNSKLDMLILSCVWSTGLTQVVMNTLTASMVLPIAADLSKKTKLHPYFVMYPSCLCSAFAFLFDFSTPSNAIIMSAYNISTIDTFKAGIFLTVFCPIFVMLFYPSICDTFYNFKNLPI